MSRISFAGSRASSANYRNDDATINALGSGVRACIRVFACFACIHARLALNTGSVADRRAVETATETDFTMVLGSSSATILPARSAPYGYALWLSSLRAHHLDRRDISSGIKSMPCMARARQFLRGVNQTYTVADTCNPRFVSYDRLINTAEIDVSRRVSRAHKGNCSGE